MNDHVEMVVKYYKGQNNGRGPGYEFSHSYGEAWDKIDMYCPNCGKQEVWKEDSAGDYYVGEGFMCTACENEWTIQGPTLATKNPCISYSQGQQRIDAIRSALQNEVVK